MGKITTTENAPKQALMWITIMLSINLLLAGYQISIIPDFVELSENALYDMILFSPFGSSYGDFLPDQGINDDVSVNDIKGDDSTGVIDYILDKIDGLIKFVAWILFVIVLLGAGGLFTGLGIWLYFDLNPFIELILYLFLGIGQVTYWLAIYKLVFNKGRID